MAICPGGHNSASADFCDVCGVRIAAGGYDRPSAPGRPATGSGAHGGTEPCPRCGTSRVGQFCETCGYRFGAVQPPWAPATPAPPPASAASFSSPPAPVPWPPPPAAPPRSSQPPPWAPAPPAPNAPPAPSVPPAPNAPRPYAPVGWTAVVSCDPVYYEAVQAANGLDGAVVPFPSDYAERRFPLAGRQMQIGRRSVARGVDPEIDLTGPPADPGISRLHAVLIATPDGGWAVLDPGSANGTLVNGTEIPTGVQVPLHDGDRINLGGWTAITVHRG